ncbi:hypothetical protein V6269_05300 [Enterobacter roggenkampii]|uniref:hypothetical protein n=1 Tax=Enterobacter roggenkampii TaxID=1812935 RepID=UPI003B84495B
MSNIDKLAVAGDVNAKTYYIHPAAFGSTTNPGYGHVPVVHADDFEKQRAKLEAAEKRIADLEATASEPVAFRSKLKASSAAGCEHWDYTDHRQPDAFELENCVIERLYTAPPANAEPIAWLWSHRKHPSEVTLVRPEDDERAEGAHWSGWSCQALYAAPQQEVKP